MSDPNGSATGVTNNAVSSGVGRGRGAALPRNRQSGIRILQARNPKMERWSKPSSSKI